MLTHNNGQRIARLQHLVLRRRCTGQPHPALGNAQHPRLTRLGRQRPTGCQTPAPAAVRLVRQTAGRRSVAITTWASFASMWLIPRLEEFQRDHPGIDIRIDASDAQLDLDTSDVDLALRYSVPGPATQGGMRLFGEQLAVVASPWLLKGKPELRTPADVAQFTLIEASDAHRSAHLEWLSWRRWLDIQGVDKLQPERWLYFNYAHQIAQAALSGQGLALSRMPLIADALAAGDLLEVLPQHRIDTPLAYWLMVGPRSAQRPEVKAFCTWLAAQAEITRAAIGDGPDPDTQDHLD